MRQFHFDFYSFFLFFGSGFFLNGFPNPFIVRSWSSFLFSRWKFFELYVRTCPAIFFYFAIFVTTIWRHNHFKSAFCSLIHAISTEVRVWRHFLLLVERVFCSFAWLNFWSHLTYLTLKNDFLILKLTFFTLIQREKVKWVCVTLNEGYLRAANRGSKNLYRFLDLFCFAPPPPPA